MGLFRGGGLAEVSWSEEARRGSARQILKWALNFARWHRSPAAEGSRRFRGWDLQPANVRFHGSGCRRASGWVIPVWANLGLPRGRQRKRQRTGAIKALCAARRAVPTVAVRRVECLHEKGGVHRLLAFVRGRGRARAKGGRPLREQSEN